MSRSRSINVRPALVCRAGVGVIGLRVEMFHLLFFGVLCESGV